jgi:serine/threonine protein phosphatase PrpC
MEITAPLRVEDLRAGWAAKAAGRPRMHATLAVGAKSDLGRARENNEDKFDLLEPDDPGLLARKGRIYAVADGMGGHSAGQIASELGLNTLIRAYYDDPSGEPEKALRHALAEANAVLVEIGSAIPGRNGMGTTVTGAVVREDELIAFHVGDSRLYRLTAEGIEQLTQDHSWVAEQVRMGTMTEGEANASPFRNVITRSLGASPELEPDLFRVRLRPGERYLFCSDGLNGMVADEELLRWGRQGSPSVAAWNLVELANQYGGKDNITVLVLDVASVEPWEPAADAVRKPENKEETEQEGVESGAVPAPSSLHRAAPGAVPPPLPPAAPLSPPRATPAPVVDRRSWVASAATFMRGLFGRTNP